MSTSARSAVALLMLGLATAASAGGPIYTFDPFNRVPYAWVMESWPQKEVPIRTDLGTLGRLSNERALKMVRFAADQWSSVPTSSFRGAVVGDFSTIGLGDIDDSTIGSVIGAWNGGGIDVVYDNDGSILTNFFGLPPTGVLGITNLEYVASDTSEMAEAWMVLSGPGIHADDPTGIGFQGVVTHEMGHALNLAHSQANGAAENPNLLDPPQPPGCGAPWTGTVNAEQVETMYPFSDPSPGQSGEYMSTVDRIDDMAALSDIYPAWGYPGNQGTIRGEIRDASGELVTGVNVIARNVADPFNDFSSYITAQVSKGEAGPDGSFVFNNLTPGASYVLYVDALLNGAFSVPPIIVLPGPEEYFNGAMESGDGSTDSRCSWTTVMVAAGAPVTANITFNRTPGAPEFIQPSPRALGIPTDITADGSVVVGSVDGGSPNAGTGFRWDLNLGTYEDIGGTGQKATISDDGTRIAGNVLDTDGTIKAAIYENGNWTPLPPVPGAVPCADLGIPVYTSVQDISGDGNTVVGLSYGAAGCYSATTRGFKWTEAGGTVALPKLDTFDQPGRANALNFNGSVIVGWDQASSGVRRAVQWRNGTTSFIKSGTQNVGEALNVSRDGQYVVGVAGGATTGETWRYTPPTGVERLGLLPGQTGGAANGISDDHEVITGYSSSFQTGGITPAIWTSSLRFSDLNQLFASQGINTSGAFPLASTAVSGDGRTIAGQMISRYGYVPWVVKIPTVLVCHADQTQIVSFPQGMNAAILQGDTLGPCQSSAAPPTGLTSVRADKPLPGTTRFSWDAVADATGYDVTRGSLSALRSTGGNFSAAVDGCLENDLTANTHEDADMPEPGDGYWYLVRATSLGGAASFDSGAPSQVASRDAGIEASPYACP